MPRNSGEFRVQSSEYDVNTLHSELPTRHSERGSVFIYIMLGIILFAALMFTFSRSTRQSGANVTRQQIELAASDLGSFAQQLDRAASRVMTRDGMSEAYLSFENSHLAGYVNAACNLQPDPDRCRIFRSTGGGANWQDPPEFLHTGGSWVFTGANEVPGAGDDARADLVLLLSNIPVEACNGINEALGLSFASPPDDSDALAVTPFTGAFANGTRIGDPATDAALQGVNAACIQHTVPDPDVYVFYSVIMAR